MITRQPWTQHVFPTAFSPGWIYNVIERLEGTMPRLRVLCGALNESMASTKWNDQWSIKDHVGHLHDLEILHKGRLEDFTARKSVLRAADMQNAMTEQAMHVEKSLPFLLDQLESSRRSFLDSLSNLDDETMYFESLHPRLNTLMKPVDLAFFVAEHDDHHLATIRFIIHKYA